MEGTPVSNDVVKQAVEFARSLPGNLFWQFLAEFYEVGRYALEDFADTLYFSFSQEDEGWVLEMIQRYGTKIAQRKKNRPFFRLVREDIEGVAQGMGVDLTEKQLEWFRNHLDIPKWAEVVATYIDLARQKCPE